MTSKPNFHPAETSTPSPLRDKLLPGLRHRHDGWTEARLSVFLATLGSTGCIRDAARVAGVPVKGANDIRVRFPAFAAAWEDALARAQKGLLAVAHDHAVRGKETVIIRDGKEVERRITPDSATLGLLIKRGDQGGVQDPVTGRFLNAKEAAARGLNTGAGLDPDSYLTWEEWEKGVRFSAGMTKISGRVVGAKERLIAKLDEMRANQAAHLRAQGKCPACLGPEPDAELRALRLREDGAR